MIKDGRSEDMRKKNAFIFAVVSMLLVSMMGSSWAAEPQAFDGWAKDARIGGAAVWVGMTTAEISAVVTKMANENVSVIEADSELSEYLTDVQFEQNLALMSEFAQAAHGKGLRVVWYYPALEVLTANGETPTVPSMFKDHPTWVQYGLNGSPNVFYGSLVFWVDPGTESAWMSPSSLGYRQYIYARAARIAATGIDGLWMDVPLLNDIGVLWADTNPSSVAAFKAATGLDTPVVVNWNDPVWRRWVSWRHQEVTDFLEGLKTACRTVNPEFPVIIETVTMDYNAATGIGLDGSSLKGSEGMTHVWELDAISDTSSMRNAKEDDWISMIAMNKFARGASGSKPAWMFGYGKLEDDAKIVMAEILAAGNNPYETKIPQMATSVGAVYRTRMFGWVSENSAYLYDRQTAAKVAVYYSPPTRDYVDKNLGVGLYATTAKPSGIAQWWSTDVTDSAYSRQYLAEYRGVVKFLVHSHIPFDVIVEPDQAELSGYETVILPDTEAISSGQANLIRQYVQSGGRAVFTGPNPTGLNELGDPQGDYLLADVLGFSKGGGSVPQNVYGLGEVRYFAGLLGKSYFNGSDAAALAQLRASIPETSAGVITTDADRRVHFELSYSGDDLILQMVNFIGVDGTFAVAPTTFEVSLAIPMGKQATAVSLTSPDNGTDVLQPVAFTKVGQRISFTTSLSEYSMVVVALGSDSNAMPTAVAAPSTPTNGDVTVTISYSSDSVVKQYKIGTAGTYTDYTAPVLISANDTLFFKGQDAAGVWSPEGSLVIGNIDREAPAAPTAVASPSTPTSGEVAVTITYSADSAVKQYKVGAAGTYTGYTAPIMLSANDTVWFKGQDAAGNWSAEESLVIGNIVPAPPAAPTLSAAPVTPTNGDVTVTITYSANSVLKEYRIGTGSWMEYTVPVVIGTNDTVAARGTDGGGAVSAEGSLVISNIDRIAPAAPTAAAYPAVTTSSVVTVTFTYSADSAVKEYRIGGAGIWKDYTAPVDLTANDTVFARGTDLAGNVSDEGSIVISNVDPGAPAMPATPTLSAAPAAPTNGDVTVTIAYSADSVLKEFRLGAGPWTEYTAPIIISSNDTVAARGTDAIGNSSAEGVLVISNIDREAPEAPIATASPTTQTTGDVLVTIVYSADSTVKEYRIGAAGTWTVYTSPVAIHDNDAVYARGTDAAGNASAETSLEIGNIDRTDPETPPAAPPETPPASGGGGGGGGGGGSNTLPAIRIVTEGTPLSAVGTSLITPAFELGTASASITPAVVDFLIKQGGPIAISIETPVNTKTLRISIPQSELNRIAAGTDSSFAFNSPFISMTFDRKALEAISNADEGMVVITAGILDQDGLSESAKAKVNGRPVYEITVINGNKKVSDLGGGHGTVMIPYALRQGESPNAVVIYTLADDGSLNTIRGRYDSRAQSVLFTTPHFSKFVVGYNMMSFNDVSADAWYRNAVEFIAARGITSGISEKAYGPETKLTRAQFLVLLMNAYHISTQNDGRQIPNFTDAGDTYYTRYLLAARGLGVVNGVGGDRFAPDSEITRQEMFVMLYNVLKVIDEFPTAAIDKSMESFKDAGKVAPWANEALSALVKAGVAGGSDNSLNPETTTTRAEMAQILYNLQSK